MVQEAFRRAPGSPGRGCTGDDPLPYLRKAVVNLGTLAGFDDASSPARYAPTPPTPALVVRKTDAARTGAA